MTNEAEDRIETEEEGGIGRMMVDIRHLTPNQFAQLGMPMIAYVKPVVVNGDSAFAIHGADGTPMGVAPGLDVAFAAVVQHEMMPVRVH